MQHSCAYIHPSISLLLRLFKSQSRLCPFLFPCILYIKQYLLTLLRMQRQDGDGTCQNTADCTTQGFNLAGYCPGPTDIQCCIKKTCNTGSSSGVCMNTSDKCGGSFVAGFCPGDSTIQVIITTPSSSTPDYHQLLSYMINTVLHQDFLSSPLQWFRRFACCCSSC